MRLIHDEAQAASEYYGTKFSYEDVLSDLEQMEKQRNRYADALEAVLSALEDVGMDHSKAHELARTALEGK